VKRILIAEDEPRIASFLEKGLRARGYATTTCETGTDALELAGTGEFDLLVLDLGLPDRDGSHVLRELRQHDRRMPVIILTARDSEHDTVHRPRGRRGRLRHQTVSFRRVGCAHPRPAARRPSARADRIGRR
jgi:CheY-like chemotaxis protein